MSNTTSINLGEHFTGFLNKLTKSGRYGSVSEAVRAALRMLEQEEAEYEALLRALDEGEESGDSNRSIAEIVADAKVGFHSV
jgi:antitoxin ParD1/3/4